jgi:hypothetical protein
VPVAGRWCRWWTCPAGGPGLPDSSARRRPIHRAPSGERAPGVSVADPTPTAATAHCENEDHHGGDGCHSDPEEGSTKNTLHDRHPFLGSEHPLGRAQPSPCKYPNRLPMRSPRDAPPGRARRAEITGLPRSPPGVAGERPSGFCDLPVVVITALTSTFLSHPVTGCHTESRGVEDRLRTTDVPSPGPTLRRQSGARARTGPWR